MSPMTMEPSAMTAASHPGSLLWLIPFLPFEILSVILLVALVGAVVLAKSERV